MGIHREAITISGVSVTLERANGRWRAYEQESPDTRHLLADAKSREQAIIAARASLQSAYTVLDSDDDDASENKSENPRRILDNRFPQVLE